MEEWEVGRATNGVSNGCGKGEGCCKKQGEQGGCCQQGGTREITSNLVSNSDFAPYDPSQEVIFPPELKLSDTLDKQFLMLRGERVTWYRPTTLNELLYLKAKFPAARIVVGNTEVGV